MIKKNKLGKLLLATGPYASLEHLEAHVSWLARQIADKAERSLLGLYYSVEAKVFPHSGLLLNLDALERAIEPHRYECAKFQLGPLPVCDCTDSELLGSEEWFADLERELSRPTHQHQAANGTLWHQGTAWSYCRECGEWLGPWKVN